MIEVGELRRRKITVENNGQNPGFPKSARVRIPGTRELVLLLGKQDFADVVTDKDLRQGLVPAYPVDPCSPHESLKGEPASWLWSEMQTG